MKKYGVSLVLLVPVVVVILDGVSLRSLLFAVVFLAGYVFAGSPAGVKLRSKFPRRIDIG
jgi:hypothetical protein